MKVVFRLEKIHESCEEYIMKNKTCKNPIVFLFEFFEDPG